MIGSSTTPTTPAIPAELAERVRPTSLAGTRLIPVVAEVAGLLPDHGLRRGSTVVVSSNGVPGATSLGLALVSRASRQGCWTAFIGMGDLNPHAAFEAGIDVDTSVFVLPGAHWPQATASMAEGVDVVLARPHGPLGSSVTRRLVAKVRQYRSVLIVLTSTLSWAEPPDVHLEVASSSWSGADCGHGCFVVRSLEVVAAARRAAGRQLRASFLLPGTNRFIERT